MRIKGHNPDMLPDKEIQSLLKRVGERLERGEITDEVGDTAGVEKAVRNLPATDSRLVK